MSTAGRNYFTPLAIKKEKKTCLDLICCFAENLMYIFYRYQIP